MNVYDQAHELARSLKQSEEYLEYNKLREIAYRDETNRALLDEYKRLQYRLQALMASGRGAQDGGEDMQRMQKIAQVLQFNSDCGAYLLAEFRFQKVLADIYKILGEVAGIDLDMLVQG